MSIRSALNRPTPVDIACDTAAGSRSGNLAARLTAPLSRLLAQPSLQSAKMRFGFGVVGFFFLIALVGPLLVQRDPMAFSADQLQPPSWAHWLGTTQTGQDIFAQLVLGTRATLLVGFATGALATLLSVVIGLIAGYFGGVVDEALSLLINIFLVMPALPLAIVLAGYVPVHGPLPVALVISFTWPGRFRNDSLQP